MRRRALERALVRPRGVPREVAPAVSRGALTPSQGLETLAQVEPCARRSSSPESLGQETWDVAEELEWAKTYDAEYVALARVLGCRLVTLDARLRRGAGRLGFVVTPAEL